MGDSSVLCLRAIFSCPLGSRHLLKDPLFPHSKIKVSHSIKHARVVKTLSLLSPRRSFVPSRRRLARIKGSGERELWNRAAHFQCLPAGFHINHNPTSPLMEYSAGQKLSEEEFAVTAACHCCVLSLAECITLSYLNWGPARGTFWT